MCLPDDKIRCAWVGDDPLYRRYHDEEWCVPCRDARKLFELLILEGVQAGLSWITILRKRENYQRLFDNFDAEKIARYDQHKIEELLSDARIVRNRLKVNAAVTNARAFLELEQKPGGFSGFLWRFVDDQPVCNHWRAIDEVPVSTSESDAMSKALKQHGFKFVGTTICYAFMQAVGMVNDHTVDCFRHRRISCGQR